MACDLFIMPSQAEQDLKWAKIWYSKLKAFTLERATSSLSPSHSGQSSSGGTNSDESVSLQWDFSVDQVIAFLQSKRDAGVPAWKRMNIIRAFIAERA